MSVKNVATHNVLKPRQDGNAGNRIIHLRKLENDNKCISNSKIKLAYENTFKKNNQTTALIQHHQQISYLTIKSNGF